MQCRAVSNCVGFYTQPPAVGYVKEFDGEGFEDPICSNYDIVTTISGIRAWELAAVAPAGVKCLGDDIHPLLRLQVQG